MGPHRQVTLRDVRKALNGSLTLPHAKLFQDLVNSTNNNPLKCTPNTRERFGAAMVTLTKQSPFRHVSQQISNSTQVRDILLQELNTHKERGGSKQIYWAPPPPSPPTPPPESSEDATTTPQSDEDSASYLLHALPDLTFTHPGHIPSLLCPHLDALASFTHDTTCTSSLAISQTIMEASVFPRGTLIPLQHANEAITTCTLLSGALVWMIWPPTASNLAIMQDAYETHDDGAFEDVAKLMFGGVTCAQGVGEVLRIPPFCVVLALATEMSALCRYSVFEAHRVVPTLRLVPFLRSWWASVEEEDGGVERGAAFGGALVAPVGGILEGVYEGSQVGGVEAQAGPLGLLLQGWDEVKSEFVGILTEERAGELKGLMMGFLRKVGEVSKACAICGAATDGVDLIELHFHLSHWPGNDGNGAIQMNPARVDGAGEGGQGIQLPPLRARI